MSFSIRNKIKQEKLKNSIANIISNVKDFHDKQYLYSFTDHGINHSNRMLQCINKLLDGCHQRNLLNEYESYILVAAVYLHDVGIQSSRIDLLKRFAESHNIPFDEIDDIPSFVRNKHHLISSFLIDEDINCIGEHLVYDGDYELGKYISYVVESHGIDFSKDPSKYKTYIYLDTSIRVDLISVLLCLADSFDCDRRRIDERKFKYMELPVISRIHWKKHLYVNGINFENRIVTISYNFPAVGKNEQKIYTMFFCEETEYWIKYIKEKYISILNKADIIFDLKREINFNKFISKLSEDDYNFIEETVFNNVISMDGEAKYKTVSIGIVIHDKKVLMVQRRKPEKSITGDTKSILEWQFPAGVIKTGEDPEIAIVREVYEETGVKCIVERKIGGRLHPDTRILCYYYLLTYKEGIINNGDVNENITVEWVSPNDCRGKITSDIYWKVNDLLNEVNL